MKLFTNILEKNVVGVIEKKRFWISKNKSVAYGHYSIPQVLTCEYIKPAKKWKN